MPQLDGVAEVLGQRRQAGFQRGKIRGGEGGRQLQHEGSQARAERLTVLLGEFLDYEKLARLSLDREWDKRTPKERARFVSLLRQLVERQYQRNMESTLQYKVSWVGTEPVDADSVLVKSSARSQRKKRQPAITIDYTMSPYGKEWRVWDIWTDGVSLVKNYRRQFRRVIRDEGWNGLRAQGEDRAETHLSRLELAEHQLGLAGEISGAGFVRTALAHAGRSRRRGRCR